MLGNRIHRRRKISPNPSLQKRGIVKIPLFTNPLSNSSFYKGGEGDLEERYKNL